MRHAYYACKEGSHLVMLHFCCFRIDQLRRVPNRTANCSFLLPRMSPPAVNLLLLLNSSFVLYCATRRQIKQSEAHNVPRIDQQPKMVTHLTIYSMAKSAIESTSAVTIKQVKRNSPVRQSTQYRVLAKASPECISSSWRNA